MALTIVHPDVSTLPDDPTQPLQIQPSWWNKNLTVSGVMDAANGGTGSANFTVAGPSVARTYTFPDANTTVLTTNAAVTVAQGGTGLASYTVGDLLVASGATTFAKIPAVAVGQVFVSAGVGVAGVWSPSPTLTGTQRTTVDAIAVTSTDGQVLQNTTPATSGIPVQISPRTRWSGTGWDTDDAVSRTMNWWAEVTGSSGAVLVSTWRLLYALDAGGAATPLQLTNAGALTITGGLTCTTVTASSAVQAGASSVIGWTGLTRLVATVDAKLNCWNNALTLGVGLDWSVNAVLKIRTTGQSAYATVDALGYSVSGVAGASKTAGPVTSITVVNGIVTACT